MESNKPGLRIQFLIPGSPAVKAGIQPGDRLIAVDGKPVNSHEDYVAATAEWSSTRTYDIVRGNKLLTLTLELPERTDEPVDYYTLASLLSEPEGNLN